MHDHAELELVSAVLKSLRYNSLIKKQHLKLKSELIDVNSTNMKTTFEDGPATAVDGWKVRRIGSLCLASRRRPSIHSDSRRVLRAR